MGAPAGFGPLLQVARAAGQALREADVGFVLAGGIASWARGGPPTEHDVDIFVRPADVAEVLAVLGGAGMEIVDPPEEWLHKAVQHVDGERVELDVIHQPVGIDIDDGFFERADAMEVEGVTMLVAAAEDILVTKLLALDDHHADLESVLEVGRALREQIDWASVRARTEASPFAAGYLVTAERLGIC